MLPGKTWNTEELPQAGPFIELCVGSRPRALKAGATCLENWQREAVFLVLRCLLDRDDRLEPEDPHRAPVELDFHRQRH